MRQLFAITLNDLRVYFSELGNLIGLIALPVALTLMIGLSSPGGGGDGTSFIFADLIDQDQSAESQQFIENLQRVNETLVLCMSENPDERCGIEEGETLTIESSTARVRDTNLQALIVIPEGYGESVQQGSPIEISYYSVASGTESFNDPVLTAVQAAVQRANAAITVSTAGTYGAENFSLPTGETNLIPEEEQREAFSADLRDRAEEMLAGDTVSVNFVLAQGEDSAAAVGTGFGQAVTGQGTMFVMFTVLGGMALLVRERELWTLQRVIISPVSRAQILGGKILAYFILGMIQYGVVFIIGFVTGTNFGDDPLALVTIMVSFVLATTALGFALSTLLENEGQVGGLSLLLALTLAPLGGAWWPLEITPDFMQVIGHLSPVAWAMDGFNELVFFGGSFADVLIPIGVLLGFAAVFFTFAIWNFKYE